MSLSIRPLDKPELHRGYVQMTLTKYPEYGDNLDHLDTDSAVWTWLESYPLARGMQRFVLVTEAEEVVGHLAAVPQLYRIKGSQVAAHTPADFVVLDGYGFYALSLMRKFFRDYRDSVACDYFEESNRIQRWLGANEVSKLRFAVKFLDISQLVQDSRFMPESMTKLINRGLRAVDNLPIHSLEDDLKVEELGGFDESFDKLFEAVASTVPCMTEKTAAFLRWRYGPGSPTEPVTVLGVKGENSLLGYAVLRVTSRAPKEGYLLDLTTLPGRQDVARALCREASFRFAQMGAYIVKYKFLESVTSPRLQDLQRLGFITRREGYDTLSVRFADARLGETACDPANWSYSIGDTIASCAGAFRPSR